ncbi:expressed unknown protein [Ectocarpus siliculosus]|uniref:LNR domain-containing protein n=1 Tax=Ectocarpus siliculosus TaxID=2880 RepID=D8LR05_ECTSI|nr:expressed unknown protein [Ectocarpus siliculosus]|eukprot:CBN77678.1 expressed unknown protein [Ectocarpus siliculosus]
MWPEFGQALRWRWRLFDLLTAIFFTGAQGYSSSADYPDCEGFIGRIGTGICTPENNNELCGYDGGDCCWCDCDSTEYPCEEQGDSSYNCIDPETTCKEEEEEEEGSLPIRGLQESPRVDNTGVPTSSPTTAAPIADSSTFSPTAAAMPVVPVSPGVSQPTDPSSDGVPLGPVVGGVVGGLVIVAIILAVAIKAGLLKNSRHSNTGPTPAAPVDPAYPAALQQYPSQSSGRPTTQYPGAHQYPAPVQ